MKAWHNKFRILVILIVISSLVIPHATAYAWKPTTHVYLAELALQDALDNGKLTIYATDYAGGKVLANSSGNPVIIGEYPVDAQVLEALRSHPEQFRAGVLGPDAYPDIATGQQIIHPAGKDTPGQPSGVDINPGGPGTNPWLAYLYSRAFTGCNPDGTNCNAQDMTSANQAFVLGFFSHAAGDMYGHTFINYYTGGPFHFAPSQENAIKHVVLEGYIDKRTPELESYEASIADGVDLFIYRNMVNALPNSYLAQNLLVGNNKDFSLPYIFSKLRAELETEIGAYNDALADYDHRYNDKVEAAENCALTDFTCSKAVLYSEATAIQGERTAYVIANGIQAEYKKAWREDIDQGLRALPETSHELAKALFFNPNGLDRARAQQIAEDYTQQHILSMAGLPDFVGASLELIDSVLEAIGIPVLKEAIDQMKRDLLNYLLSKAFNVTIEQIEEYLKNPEQNFDPILNDPALNLEGTGHLINLQSFNTEQLHISDTGYSAPEERYNYQIFPAAYNSVVMIKLLLMSPDGVNQLLHDLHPNTASSLSQPNIMLGFIETLDGSNQWSVNTDPKKMVLATDCLAYRKIFMQQVGEDVISCEAEPSTPIETSEPDGTSTETCPTACAPTETSEPDGTSTETCPTVSVPTETSEPDGTSTETCPTACAPTETNEPDGTSTETCPTVSVPTDSNLPSVASGRLIPPWVMTVIIVIALITWLLLCAVLISVLLLSLRLFSDWRMPETWARRSHLVTESPLEKDDLTAQELASALAAKEEAITELKEKLATQEALIEQLRSRARNKFTP